MPSEEAVRLFGFLEGQLSSLGGMIIIDAEKYTVQITDQGEPGLPEKLALTEN